MSHVDRLFEEFKAAHAAGAEPDPAASLAGLQGADRAELTALIDGYLSRAPRRAWDADAFAASPAAPLAESLGKAVQGSSGLWPSLLPRLRERARVKRSDLVTELAERLGAQGQRAKVEGYYHSMEQGTLPAPGVADEVLDALAAIVDSTRQALREAGEAISSAPPAAGSPQAFARTAPGAPSEVEAGEARSAPEADLDEVDRLFLGR